MDRLSLLTDGFYPADERWQRVSDGLSDIRPVMWREEQSEAATWSTKEPSSPDWHERQTPS